MKEAVDVSADDAVTVPVNTSVASCRSLAARSSEKPVHSVVPAPAGGAATTMSATTRSA